MVIKLTANINVLVKKKKRLPDNATLSWTMKSVNRRTSIVHALLGTFRKIDKGFNEASLTEAAQNSIDKVRAMIKTNAIQK